VPALHHELADKMRVQHFVQCGARAYMDVAGAAPRPTPAPAPEYARMMGLGRGARPGRGGGRDADGAAQRREAVIQHALLRARRSFLADTSSAGIPYGVLYRLANSGALDAPPVLVVALDAAGNAFVDHVHAGRLDAAEGRGVHVCLAWRGAYEPLGAFNNKRFEPLWSAEHPWIKGLTAALRRAVRAPPDEAYRVVTHSLMAIGSVTRSKAYVPFDAPVPIDPDALHRYVSDGALTGVTGAKGAKHKSKDRKRDVGTIVEDDAKDGMLFGNDALEDTRARTLRDLKRRLRALHDVQMAVARRGIKDEAGIRREARRLVPRDADAQEYAVAGLLRPVPGDALPFVDLAEHETFV
jgi:hypothetical protein